MKTAILAPSLTPVAYINGHFVWCLFAVPVRVTHKRRRAVA